MMQAYIEKWQQRSTRERILLIVGAIFMVISLFYVMIWEPLSTAVKHYRQDVISNKMLLQQIKQAGPEIATLRSQMKQSQIKNQAELISVIEKAVKKSRVQGAISEIGLGPENSARLRFDDVGFDELMAWLIDLQQTQGIVVNTFNVEKLSVVGHVRAQLTVTAV